MQRRKHRIVRTKFGVAGQVQHFGGIIVRVSDDLTARVKAGDIIREIAPIVGGRGGGKADMAEGGGTDPDKLAEAIDAAYDVIARMAS